MAKKNVPKVDTATEASRASIKRYVSNMNEFKLTSKQKELLRVLNDNKIIFITGPAGTAKTFMSCYYITDLLAKHTTDYETFILTKPVEEAGEKLGLLPGDVKDKIGPHYESYLHNLKKLIPTHDLIRQLESKKIDFRPLAYMRGINFDKCFDGKTAVATDAGIITMEQLFTEQWNTKKHKILSYNIKTKTSEFKELTGVQTDKTFTPMLRITFNTGEFIECTDDHELYTTDLKCIEAKDLKINDKIYSTDKKHITDIENIEDYDENVYSLQVADNHNYFLANGILSKNCVAVLDEAQNADIRQIMMFITRMGKDSKIIISGDISQYDINQKAVAINYLKNIISDVDKVAFFEFTKEDIMRDEILIQITDRYEKAKAFDTNFPRNKR